MNPLQIQLVQSSFRTVAGIAPQAAALFYDRLFELDPNLRPLFRGDLAAQGRKLMTMLGLVVGHLERFESLLDAVRGLGVRHVAYGVRDEHYDTVGAALLWTLQQGLGEAFTAEVKAAWAATYVTLATVMKDAARAALTPAALPAA